MKHLERLIGWITVSFGASFIFKNTSLLYQFMTSHEITLYFTVVMITLGFAMIYQSYGTVLISRLFLLLMAGFVWGLTFITVVSAEPNSPFAVTASISIVMCVYCFLSSSTLLNRIKVQEGENL